MKLIWLMLLLVTLSVSDTIYSKTIYSKTIYSKTVSIKMPPNINQIEQEKHALWKDYFLKSLEEKKQKLAINEDQSIFLNELIYSESPYLIQHAFNPVNWKPWRTEILQKAKRENKLIFLSIGYSTCHWCHTMEKESFMDVDIASLINRDYLAIKVDREELPHIDDYFAAALEQVKGSAGWPITVIINGDGLPVFIDSYLSKQKLSKLLTRVNTVWKEQPSFLLSNAKTIDSLVRARFSSNLSNSEAGNIQERYEQLDLNKKLVEELDSKNGGFKGQVKFPSEPMLLYALDQLRRASNSELEKLVELQLDGMISGGLYDHIGGGFHRYSTDSDWTVPHYEKMLYNQAQLVEVYSQAYQFFRKPAYKKVVESSMESLLTNFYIEDKGFASAIDADFEGKEGGYYLWTEEEIVNIRKSEAIKKNINLFKTYTVIDKSTKRPIYGVLFPPAINEKESNIVSKIRKELNDLRKTKGNPHVDKKVLTGWNALVIKSLLSAGELLNNQGYVNSAKSLSELLWSERFNESTGFLSRTGFNDNLPIEQSSKHAYLEDYAYFADALIRLYDITENIVWLKRAEILRNALLVNFLDEDGGLINVVNLNTELSLKKSNDSELLSPTAVSIDVISKLDRRLGTNLLKRQYLNVVGNIKSKVLKEPLSHLYGNFSLNQFEKGSTASRRYFASSKGRLQFSCKVYLEEFCAEMVIQFKLEEGWHVNSNAPLQDYLIPTKVAAKEGVEVSYPVEQRVKLGFQKEPLSVYQGQFQIIIKRKGNKKPEVYMELPLQACNDIVCMLPEVFNFTM